MAERSADTEPLENRTRSPKTFGAVWRMARSLIWRTFRGGPSRASCEEMATPGAAINTAMEVFHFGVAGLATGAFIGIVISFLLRRSPVPGFPMVFTLLRESGASFCAGVVWSRGSAAIDANGSYDVQGRSGLALLRLQVGAELVAFESTARTTGVASLFGLSLVAVARGPLAGAHATLGLIVGIVAGIMQNVHGAFFLLGLTLTVSSASGTGAQCIIGTILGVAACLRFWIRWLQDKLLYHPRRYDGDTDMWGELRDFGGQAKGFIMQKVTTTLKGRLTGKSEQTAFLVRPVAQDVTALWVICGGNAMLATEWLIYLDRILQTKADPTRGQPFLGAAFLLIDYPGYGWNGGRPSPAAILAASRQALHAAVASLGAASPPKVHLLGHSLGSAAVTQLAAQCVKEGVAPGRLLLSAPFLNVPQMAERILGGLLPEALFPLFPPLLNLLVPHRWDTAATLPAVARAGWRVGIVHGALDALVPTSMGKELHRIAVASGGPSPTFAEVPRAGHNDVLLAALPEYIRLMSFAASCPV